jgi:hypothetical protein
VEGKSGALELPDGGRFPFPSNLNSAHFKPGDVIDLAKMQRELQPSSPPSVAHSAAFFASCALASWNRVQPAVAVAMTEPKVTSGTAKLKGSRLPTEPNFHPDQVQAADATVSSSQA